MKEQNLKRFEIFFSKITEAEMKYTVFAESEEEAKEMLAESKNSYYSPDYDRINGVVTKIIRIN